MSQVSTMSMTSLADAAGALLPGGTSRPGTTAGGSRRSTAAPSRSSGGGQRRGTGSRRSTAESQAADETGEGTAAATADGSDYHIPAEADSDGLDCPPSFKYVAASDSSQVVVGHSMSYGKAASWQLLEGASEVYVPHMSELQAEKAMLFG